MTSVPVIDCDALLIEADLTLAARLPCEAIRLFCAAEDAGALPDRCASGRWIASMLLGEYENAWQEGDSIRRRALPDSHRFWQGEDITGQRVIVRCLHGYGDAVQFLRYAPLLKALASQLIVEVPPRFVELAKCLDGIDHVITWGVDSPSRAPTWDVQIEVMELPYIFRTRTGDLPLFTKYLHVPAAPSFDLRQPGRLRIGVAWSSGSWNSARSIRTDMLQPLFPTEGCEFWNLCEASPIALAAAASTGMTLLEDADCRDSIKGLAATIAGMDLVITVDTLAAHLGGALGVRTWVLLPFAGDWRWMHERNDSPWYPSVRLFRQPAQGDWESVITAVHRELQALTHGEGERQVGQ